MVRSQGWNRYVPLLALAVLQAALAQSGGHANADRQRVRALQERVTRLQQEQAQALEEKQRAAAAQADAEKATRGLRAELEKQRAAQRSAAREQETLLAQQQAKVQRLEAAARELEEARARIKAGEAELARTRGEAQSLKASLDERTRKVATCERLNADLYTLNTDLLARYEKNAPRRGPVGDFFTRLNRVRIETEGETLRDRMDELRVAPIAP